MTRFGYNVVQLPKIPDFYELIIHIYICKKLLFILKSFFKNLKLFYITFYMMVRPHDIFKVIQSKLVLFFETFKMFSKDVAHIFK